jgi:hypothetical protein
MSKLICGDCKFKMKVPGSAHIECAWRRGHRGHVWFYEGFDPGYPNPIFECDGFQKGKGWMEELKYKTKNYYIRKPKDTAIYASLRR